MTEYKAKLLEPHTHTEFRDVSARGVRGFLRSSLALLVGLGLVGCGSSGPLPSTSAQRPSTKIASSLILGTGTFEIDTSETALNNASVRLTSTSALPDAVLNDFQVVSYSSTYNLTDRVNYVWTLYSFKNNTTSALNNINFYFYNGLATNVGGTAFLNIRDLNGKTYSDPELARSIVPFAGASYSGGVLNVDATKTNFQALQPSEARQLSIDGQQTQPPVLAIGDHVLEYGFSAVNAMGERSIAPGATGYVAVAFRRPLFNDTSTYRFQFQYLLATDPYTRTTRAPGETTASAVARAQAAGATQLGLVGIDDDVAPAPLETVRVCDPLYYVGQAVEPCDGRVEVTAEIDPTILSPVRFAGEDSYFAAVGPDETETKYRWDFGDGSSATERYAVHEYAQPGRYTATLTVTDETGQTTSSTTSVAVMPNIHNIPSTRAAQDAAPVVFDVKYPVDGFSYEWILGDGTTVTGPRIEHVYTRPDFYDVTLKVYDNRPETLASGGERLVASQETRVNRTIAGPSAFINGSSNARTVLLNASDSVGNSALQYSWDFGDGTTAQGVTVNKTYERNGRYPITLTVTDAFGQKDVSHQLVILGIRPEELDQIVDMSYGGGSAAALRAQSVRTIPNPAIQKAFEKAQRKANAPVLFVDTPSKSSARSGLRAQADSPYDKTYAFPFVVPDQGTQISSTLAPNGAGSAFISGASSARFNSTPIARDPLTWTLGQCAQNDTLCQRANINPGFFPTTLPAGVNTFSFQTQVPEEPGTPYNYTTDFATFSGLRVPRIILAVLPDEQLPGGQTKVEEYSLDVNGKQEMFVQVSIPASQVTSGGYGIFKLPVYAVDRQGQLLNSVSGIFKARFTDPGIFSAPADGIMVGGRSEILMYVPLDQYADGSKQFDLSQIEILSAPDCSTDGQYDFAGFYMSGCTVMSTSPEVPIEAVSASGLSAQSLKAQSRTYGGLPYGYRAGGDFSSRTNRVSVGRSPREARAYDNVVRNYGGDMARFLFGFVPILGDSVDLLEQVFNRATGRQVDPVIAVLASAGLVLDLTTGGVGDVTAGIKGMYRIAKDGVIGQAIAKTVADLIAGGKKPTEAFRALSDQFGTFAKVFFKAGFQGVSRVSELANGMRTLPSCPIFTGRGLSSASCGDAPKIVSIVARISQKIYDAAEVDIVDFAKALINICCGPGSGGRGYITGAENVIADAARASLPAKGLVGIRSLAINADGLRSAGFTSLEFPRTNSYAYRDDVTGVIIYTNPDIIARGKDGVLRLIEAKTNSVPNAKQLINLRILKAMIEAERGEKVLIAIVSIGRQNAARKAFFRARGIDIYDSKGNIINPLNVVP